MTPLGELLAHPLAVVSARAPSGQLVTAVQVPGAQTVEIRVGVQLARRSDSDAAHAEVVGRCVAAHPALRRRLGLLGSDVSAGADHRRLTVAATATVEGWTETLTVLAQDLADPDPGADAVRLACGAAARGALRALASTGMQGRAALHHLIWSDHAPSRFDVPSAAALGAVAPGSLRDFARHRFGTALAAVVVGGPAPARETWERAAAALSSWTSAAVPDEVTVLPPQGPFASAVVDGAAPGRAGLRLMLPSPGRTSPGYAAARLAAAVAAGGPASRLHRRLRDEDGLVYSVNHSTETVARTVLDVVDLDLRSGDVEAAVAAVADTLRAPPDDAEVERVRRRVLGSLLVARTSLAATVGSLADLTSDGLDPGWTDRHAQAVADVPAAEVRADAAARLRTDRAWGALVTDTAADPAPTLQLTTTTGRTPR